MDFVITTFCNLCCKNCCALMPYYKKPFHYDLDTIKESLNKLSKCSKVRNIQIIGGETLLHPNINEIITFTLGLDFDIISVYTNATVIPENFDDVLKNVDDRFTLCMTDYEGKSTKIKDLVEMCEKYNVNYEICEFGNIVGSGKDKEWIKSGGPTFKPLPKIDLSTCDQVMSCMGDKIYKCQRFGHLNQVIGLELADNEWCHIDEIDERYEELKQRSFTKSCYYCLRGTKQAINIPKGS